MMNRPQAPTKALPLLPPVYPIQGLSLCLAPTKLLYEPRCPDDLNYFPPSSPGLFSYIEALRAKAEIETVPASKQAQPIGQKQKGGREHGKRKSAKRGGRTGRVAEDRGVLSSAVRTGAVLAAQENDRPTRWNQYTLKGLGPTPLGAIGLLRPAGDALRSGPAPASA